MKKLKIKSIQGNNVLLKPFSKEFISKDYLVWMNDIETTKYIQKAKRNTSLEDLYYFANQMFDGNKDYFFAII